MWNGLCQNGTEALLVFVDRRARLCGMIRSALACVTYKMDVLKIVMRFLSSCCFDASSIDT